MRKLLPIIFAITLQINLVIAQTATLRLQLPSTQPNVGEQFFVGVWLDELTWPPNPTIWSALFAWEFDPAVLTPISTGPPFNRWYHNHSQMFIDYGSLPASSNPNPDDVRVFFSTVEIYGYDPSFYGFVSGVTPFKFFDLKFTYLGGDIEIAWQDQTKLDPVEGEKYGGILSNTQTQMSAPPPPAGGVLYSLNFFGPPPICYTTGEWTGLGDGLNWFDPLNWCNQIIPTETIDVVIGNSMFTNNIVISGAIASTASLLLNLGCSIVISDDGGLTTNGLFTNNGTLTIESSGEFISTGSYIDKGGISGTGTFNFKRILACSGTLPNTADPYGWHYFTSPFVGFTSDNLPDYFAIFWDQANGQWNQVYNMMICTPMPPITLAATEVWSINHSLVYQDHFDWCFNNGTPIPPGISTVIEFSGSASELHTGIFTKSLGYGPSLYQMWNMVGNPYPSGLDLSLLNWGSNIVQAAAFYEGCAGNYIYWAAGMGSYIVPPSVGFFVETIGPANIMLDNTIRSHNAGASIKYKLDNLLTLKASGNDKADVLHVRFAEDATSGFDMAGDTRKLFSTTEGLPQIYTIAGEHLLAINSLPFTETVPMGFAATSSGLYNIEATETSNMSDLILEDKLTGTQTNLLTSAYSFEYILGSDANRFNIHFGKSSISDLNPNNIKIWSDARKIYVDVPGNITGDIAICETMGQEVFRTKINPGTNILNMRNFNKYYLVKIISNSLAFSSVVYVK